MDTQQFNTSSRLAEISRRQMAKAMALPTRATEEEERQAMQAAHEGSNGAGRNGVSKRGSPRKYSEEAKLKLAEGFQAAENKKAFAAEAGIHPAQLRRWQVELFGVPAKPEKPARKARAPRPELPAATSDLRALIAAVDGVRAALAPLPRKAALEIVEHLRRELMKG